MTEDFYLEKEALMKGVPLGKTHDIEIPPPRPKRKPCSPYPRKTGVGSLCPMGEVVDERPLKPAASLSISRQVLDKENNEPQEISAANKMLERREEASEDGSDSDVLNLFQVTPSASLSSMNKTTSNHGSYREFVPLVKDIKDVLALDESSLSIDVNTQLKKNSTSYLDQDPGKVQGIYSQTKHAQIERADLSKQSEKQSPSQTENQQGDQRLPTAVINQVGAHANAYPFINPTVLVAPELHTYLETSSIHHSFPPFPPLTLFHNQQDSCRSFHNISTSLSDLIVSTLLQNPAVHAAASLAAPFWPSSDVDTSIDSSKILVGEIPVRNMNTSPSMAAIAAATVTAASAWWATQGLLPLFPPLHPGFAYTPAPSTTVPIMKMAGAPEDIRDQVDGRSKNPARDDEALRAGHPSTKSLISSLSSSESDDNERVEASNFSELTATETNKFKPLSDTGFDNSDNVRTKKVDRSSCSSNTPSSSEVETDTVLERHEEAKDEVKQVHCNYPPAEETINRRYRSSGTINDSWKEVSEEGRLAFRALFNRDVLPQSFSPPKTKDGTLMTGIEATTLQVDPEKKASTSDIYDVQDLAKEMMESNDSSGNSSVMSGIGHGKLKPRHTGFKPYKRCSIEAKEGRESTGEETSTKRMRLESESST